MEEKEQENQAMKLLQKEAKVKYPPGSYIIFSSSRNKGEEIITASCGWYDKVGGKSPLKHIVSKPPEWQNIPIKEAEKISEMFDRNDFMNIVYV